MRTLLILFLSLFSLPSMASPMFEGNSSGGGGMGMVCHNPDGSIKSVTLLDLYEANVLYGFRLMDSPPRSELNDSFAQSMAMHRLSSVIELEIRMDSKPGPTNDVMMKFRMANRPPTLKGPDVTTVSGAAALYYLLRITAAPFFDANAPFANAETIQRVHGEKFALTTDIFQNGPGIYASAEAPQPTGCDLEQIVVFQDTGKHRGVIKINQDLVDHMDPLNEMALYAHEVLYKALRDVAGIRESLPVRRAIGLAFSESSYVMQPSDWTDRAFMENFNKAVKELQKRGAISDPVN